jgi:transcriptional regulator with XRE-family HTH domain
MLLLSTRGAVGSSGRRALGRKRLIESAQDTFVRGVRDLLERTGLKDAQLAEKSGIPPPKLSKMLRGRQYIKLNEAAQIAVALGVGLLDLLPRTGLGQGIEPLNLTDEQAIRALARNHGFELRKRKQ